MKNAMKPVYFWVFLTTSESFSALVPVQGAGTACSCQSQTEASISYSSSLLDHITSLLIPAPNFCTVKLSLLIPIWLCNSPIPVISLQLVCSCLEQEVPGLCISCCASHGAWPMCQPLDSCCFSRLSSQRLPVCLLGGLGSFRSTATEFIQFSCKFKCGIEMPQLRELALA